MLKGSSNLKVLPANKDVVDPIDLLQNGGVPVAQETADDVSLIWLADQTKLKSALALQPIPGTICSGSAEKIVEHGGFSAKDTHVMLVVSNPRLDAGKVHHPVANKQVAPTILKSLGLNPRDLQAVRMEHTSVLAGLEFED